MSALAERDRIYPLTKIALLQIHYALNERAPPYLEGYDGLIEQVNRVVRDPRRFVKPEEIKDTSMFGALIYMREGARLQSVR